MGLDPRTPGSRPGPKAGAKSLSHPGIPLKLFSRVKCFEQIMLIKVQGRKKYAPAKDTVKLPK